MFIIYLSENVIINFSISRRFHHYDDQWHWQQQHYIPAGPRELRYPNENAKFHVKHRGKVSQALILGSKENKREERVLKKATGGGWSAKYCSF